MGVEENIRESIKTGKSFNGRTTAFGAVYSGSAPEAHQPLAENPKYMFYTYVLKSVHYETRYIGSTEDVDNRLIEHNAGNVRYTKGRRPWSLIYKETYTSRSEAMRREKFLKSGQGRKFLDQILNNS